MSRIAETSGKQIMRIIMAADERLCGDGQIPAVDLQDIVNERTCRRLLFKRAILTMATLVELGADGVATAALTNPDWAIIFAAGMLIGRMSHITKWHFLNSAGIELSEITQDLIFGKTENLAAIQQAMIQGGAAAIETNALTDMPAKVYMTELWPNGLSRLEETLTPMIQSTALMATCQPIAAAGVLGFGLAANGWGRKLFVEMGKKIKVGENMAISARNFPESWALKKMHVKWTDRANIVGDLPKSIFALFYLATRGSYGASLAIFKAVTEGLSPLSGAYTREKTRVDNSRNIKIAKEMFKAFTSEGWLLTEKRWLKHIEQSETVPDTEMKNGVVIRDLTISNSDIKLTIKPLSIDIPFGQTRIIKAGSGEGKSLMFSAIQHIANHTGFVGTVTDGKINSVHRFNQEEISRRCIFVDAATTSENYMINDLLRVPFKYKYSEVYKEWLEKYPQRLIDTVWQAETGLLEDGLKSTVNGENGVIPREMAEDLKRILELKFDYTKELLGEAGGNLECDRINPTRTLATLSEGEKKRVYAMVSLAFAREVKPTLILLDEPMENQDTRNGNFQLEILRKILANDQPPALMLIAHKFTGQMEKDLNGRVVDMEEKVTGID